MEIRKIFFIIICLTSIKSYCIDDNDVYEFAKSYCIAQILKSQSNTDLNINFKNGLNLTALSAYVGYVYYSSPEERKKINSLCALGGASSGAICNKTTLGILLSGWLGLKVIKFFVSPDPKR